METGTIIVLNGASSSGKTTIIRALQSTFEEPYLDAGLDRFLFMLPGRYLDRPLWDEVLGLATRAGPPGHRLLSGMHRAVAELARSGNNVLVDHVLVEQEWIDQLCGLFGDLPAFLIGVRCPLAVLEERERSRKNRTLGQAAAQFDLVHRNLIYDLEVDSSERTAEECAGLIKARVVSGEPPTALRRLAAARGIGEFSPPV